MSDLPKFFFSSPQNSDLKFFLASSTKIVSWDPKGKASPRPLTEKNDTFDFFNSEDDYLFMSVEPNEDEDDDDDGEKEVKFKFKHPSLCYAKFGSLLFSMHQKGKNCLFIEVTCVQTFRCLNPCLIKLECSHVQEDSKSWMCCLGKDAVTDELTSNSRGDPNAACAFLFVYVSDAFTRMLMIDSSTGNLVREVKFFPEHLRFRSKADVLSRILKVKRPELDKTKMSFMQRIRQQRIVNLGAEYQDKYLSCSSIVDFQLFPNGLLLHQIDGKVTQFVQQSGKIESAVLPVPNVRFIQVTDRLGTLLTTHGDIYTFKLPFRHSDQQPQCKREIDSNEAIEKIKVNIEELERVNQIRQKQEEILKQLSILKLMKTQGLKHNFHLSSDFKMKVLYLKLENLSDQMFLGSYWRIVFDITSFKDPSTLLKQEFSLPFKFGPGDTLEFSMECIFEKYRDIQSFPLKVKAYLSFCSKHHREWKIAYTDCVDVTLGCIDVMTCQTSHKKLERPPYFPTAYNSVPKLQNEDLASFVRKLKCDSANHHNEHTDYNSNLFIIAQRFNNDFIVQNLHLPLVKKVKQLAIDEGIKDVELTCKLFNQEVLVSVVTAENSELTVTFTCKQHLLMIALKKDLQRLFINSVSKEDSIRIPKQLLSRVHELKEDLTALDEEDTMESRTQLLQIHDRLRSDISATLP